MALSLIEKETIILFNEKEEYADVYVHNVKLKRKLAELSEERPEEVRLVRSDSESVTYQIPKKWINVRPPKKMPSLTDEERKSVGERLRLSRASKA